MEGPSGVIFAPESSFVNGGTGLPGRWAFFVERVSAALCALVVSSSPALAVPHVDAREVPVPRLPAHYMVATAAHWPHVPAWKKRVTQHDLSFAEEPCRLGA